MSLNNVVALLLVVALSCGAYARVLQPCELAEVLVKKSGVSPDATGNWVCLAKFSSGFNTAAVNGPDRDGTYSYGIFQINEKYCRPGSKQYCGVSCNDLRTDDVSYSASCALKIHSKEGYNAWPAWKNDCKNKNVSQYVKRCTLRKKLISGWSFL